MGDLKRGRRYYREDLRAGASFKLVRRYYRGDLRADADFKRVRRYYLAGSTEKKEMQD